MIKNKISSLPSHYTQDTLLNAKLVPPKLSPITLPRLRIIDSLSQCPEWKLTLISAPAGFGKSTVLTEWYVAALKSKKQSISWFSVDKYDNDPVLFWSYFLAALTKFWPDLGEQTFTLSQFPNQPSIETTLNKLINIIYRISENNSSSRNYILVLDDYHWIESDEIHEMLVNFLEHQPDILQLVISTRVDPPFPLARLRAKGHLREFRTPELRFTAEETNQYFKMLGLTLTDNLVNKLETHTEGWITALKLATLSIPKQVDLATFLDNFSGSHYHIFDYLSEEVLTSQPQELQDFLLETSILDELCAPLCDAVTGVSGSQLILEKLHQSNIFLIALDEKRYWYRYHQLFAEMLRVRLAKLPLQIGPKCFTPSKLHYQASLWYETNGYIHEAINHALAAEDYIRSAILIEKYQEDFLIHSEFISVQKWLEKLPQNMVKSRPLLCLAMAMTYLGRIKFEQVETWLQFAETSLGVTICTDNQTLPVTITTILGRIDAIRSTIAINFGNSRQAIELSLRALKRLPEEDKIIKGIIALNLGDAYADNGTITQATNAFNESINLFKSCRNISLAVVAQASLGSLFAREGKLSQAAATLKQAIELAKQPVELIPTAGKAAVYLGEIYLERLELTESLAALQTGLELCKQWGHQEHTIDAYLALANAYGLRGDYDSAWKSLLAARQLNQSTLKISAAENRSLNQQKRIAGTEVGLWLLLGNFKEVEHWVIENDFFNDEKHPPFHSVEYTSLVKFLIYKGHPERSIKLLSEAIEHFNSVGHLGATVHLLALLAVAYQSFGQEIPALQTMEKALHLGEPEGYTRSFITAGVEIQTLLQKASNQGITKDYAIRLLSIATNIAKPKNIQSVYQMTNNEISQPFGEVLSSRELEILTLLVAGKSNPEIAADLFLAIGTVKKHLNNIYSKLGVTSRTQALLLAKKRGLI